MKLLVVEDDDRVMAALSSRLGSHGFDVICARTGTGALEMMRQDPQVVLLDLGLPDRDGFQVCALIRQVSQVPIIVTTARADLNSRVQGLNLGADDYLVKPYHLAELVARINAVSRRSAASPAGSAAWAERDAGTAIEVQVGDIQINPADRTVHSGGRAVPLSRREFELLEMLARHPGQVLRHEEILREVWRTTSPETRRTLHVLIASLRNKLGSPGAIESVHGVGYRLAGGG